MMEVGGGGLARKLDSDTRCLSRIQHNLGSAPNGHCRNQTVTLAGEGRGMGSALPGSQEGCM